MSNQRSGTGQKKVVITETAVDRAEVNEDKDKDVECPYGP